MNRRIGRPQPKHRRRNDIYVDVDGTLVKHGKLNDKLVKWCEMMKADGFRLYLWSARGEDYARETAQEFGVDGLFDLILSKPSYIVDDMLKGWTKYMGVIDPWRDV